MTTPNKIEETYLQQVEDTQKQKREELTQIMQMPLITVEQTAKLLQVSSRTIHTKIKNKEIPCFKMGGVVRIKREELLAL